MQDGVPAATNWTGRSVGSLAYAYPRLACVSRQSRHSRALSLHSVPTPRVVKCHGSHVEGLHISPGKIWFDREQIAIEFFSSLCISVRSPD